MLTLNIMQKAEIRGMSPGELNQLAKMRVTKRTSDLQAAQIAYARQVQREEQNQ